MPHATAATPAALPAPAATTNCRPESRRFPVIRFGRAARTSLPFVIAGTLAVSASGLSATPAHAAPVERPAMPQRFLKPTVQRTVQSVVVTSQVVASKAAQKAAPKEYTVVAGDTVSEIADRFGLKTQTVLAANGLDSTSIIFPGQHLKLAGGSAPVAKASTAKKYTVKSGDTMSGIAERTGSGLAALLAANSLVPTSIIYPGQSIVVPGADFTVASTGKAEAATDTATDELPEITMTDERRANAETVIRVGRNAGVNDYGIVIALAAAMQESGLKNFDHGDRDSLGIFQQRPSTGWGTAAQTRDPERAARAFFGGDGNPNPGKTRGLLDIPGWEKMTVSQAAQAVQISGWPNHYAKWEAAARDWLEQLG